MCRNGSSIAPPLAVFCRSRLRSRTESMIRSGQNQRAAPAGMTGAPPSLPLDLTFT